jgi:hypothetical protein
VPFGGFTFEPSAPFGGFSVEPSGSLFEPFDGFPFEPPEWPPSDPLPFEAFPPG